MHELDRKRGMFVQLSKRARELGTLRLGQGIAREDVVGESVGLSLESNLRRYSVGDAPQVLE